MTKLDAFNSFLRDRLIAFTEEIFQAVQDIVSEQQNEIKSAREEIRFLRTMLVEAAPVSAEDEELEAPTIHPDELSPEEQDHSHNPQDYESSLIQVKMEICSPDQGSNSQLPDPKISDRLSPFIPVKTEESISPKSYISIDLVPHAARTLINDEESVNENVDTLLSEPPLLMAHSKSRKRTTTLYCQICDKHFQHRFSMRNHMIVHQRSRPFICSFCGKGFKAKNHMREHERIHTGEKPYACSMCDKRFTQYNHVRAHLRNHHHADHQTLEMLKKRTPELDFSAI